MQKEDVAGDRLVPVTAVTTRKVWVDLLLYPTHSVPTAAAPVIVAMAVAFRHHVFAPLPAVVGFVASWLVHVAGLFHDNYELLVRYPDDREHPELVQACRDGALTPGALMRAIVILLTVAVLTGPYLWSVAGWPVAALGAIGIAASLSYAGGPLAYAKYGLSEIVFFLMFGVVAVVGIYYVEAAASAHADWRWALSHLPPEIWVLGLPAGALTVDILLIDDMRDQMPDAAKGWRTGAVRFGRAWAQKGSILMAAFAYIAPFWFWWRFGYGVWILLPLLTLPFAVWIVRRLHTTERLADLKPVTPQSAFLAFFYALLLSIGIIASS